MDSSLIRVRRPIRALPKPLLLKDHLLDDMSSCSSNGFKSFPRRSSQCCTTVRFLHDLDSRNKKHQQKKLNRITASKSAISAIQGFITAIKRLPFATAKSTEKRKMRNSFFLRRSFSKKLLEKSGFWRRDKSDGKDQIGQWKLYDNELLKEDVMITDSSRDSKSDGCSGSDEFTVSDDCSSGKYSSLEVNLNLPEEMNDVVQMPLKVVGEDGVGVAKNDDISNGSTSSCNNTNSPTKTTEQKQWSSDQEKEQLSPVSVLDCPFDDDDEVSSLFQHRLARMEGTKMKLMKKIQRFECLAKLEPVNLATQFPLQPDSDNESFIGSPIPHSSSSADDKSITDIEEEIEDENEAEHKALELLNQMKASYGLKLKSDELLLDFFREKITNKLSNSDKQCTLSSFENGLLEEAEGWINGQKTSERFVEWEVEKNKQAYVKDMEKGGEWKTVFDLERQEVALELENFVFAQLLNEVLLDISS